MTKRRIAILGSTGSIGRQALQVAALHPDRFAVVALTAHQNSELLFEQVRAFRPQMAGLSGGEVEIPEDCRFCRWHFGREALDIAASSVPCDDVLAAVVGIAGLESVLKARAAGRRVLLANKETLVAGGELVMKQCAPQDGRETLVPVDSEHSAIFQCLRARDGNAAEQLLLTASGGPFRTWPKADIDRATPEQALRHPNWHMGAKVTIDSASMFNKALEIIEARWLFGVRPEQISVLVHPQSVVHSMVRFADGAVLAQLGVPDMRVPILYAMSYPERLCSGVPALDFSLYPNLSFEPPDLARFPSISLAYQALTAGGAACCVLNAANETAVEAFLQKRIAFGDIYRVVRGTLDALGAPSAETLDDILDADARARRAACALLNRMEGHV